MKKSKKLFSLGILFALTLSIVQVPANSYAGECGSMCSSVKEITTFYLNGIAGWGGGAGGRGPRVM